MLYPQRVGALHLAAAGRYCLPDETMAYPYGLAADDDGKTMLWARRMRARLRAFLNRPVHLYIGTEDTARDETLRQAPALDALQGSTRHARAHHDAAALWAAAQAAGLPDRVSLTELPGCTHDVAWTIDTAGLARMVAAPGRAARRLAAAV
ncbi:hypothetical protein [Rhodovulum euryhalinum]|uniref:Alpha/beta hydrolase family protein n=1 Tax=Rhodovulum euryhalinum TaxID=35805 RepID=A0A4R2KD94_9RHOB|nr:hypothetical protein [Rhodovulum euryhalinum]TCO71551.1 hypothetical protein EV655_10643 [Rhodovulum euryhalinum]